MDYLLGILLCTAGGIGVGVYLLPLKYSNEWTWENSWLVGALFMYLVLPVTQAWIVVPNLIEIFRAANPRDLWMIYLFGLVQGSGALAFAFGITLMGLSLGYSLMISLNAVAGVMVPLVIGHPGQIPSSGGITLILGVIMLVLGVTYSGRAGRLREQAAGSSAKIRSFALVIFIALYSGIANSFFYFSFEFQKNLKAIATTQFGVREALWPLANVIPLFAGIFTVSLVYCVVKMTKDGSLRNYWRGTRLRIQYLLALAIGFLWFLGQGVCYTAGFTMLGSLGVPAGAAIFMGTMIVVSNFVGLKTGEWEQTEPRIMRLTYTGIIVEVLAIAIVGLGNYFMQAK